MYCDRIRARLRGVTAVNVRMVERGQHLRLPPEPREAVGIADELIGQDLQSDIPEELRIARLVDLSHTALPER